MNRRFITATLLMLLFSAVVSAQVEKASWLFGGSSNLEFDASTEKMKSGSTTNEVSKYTDFDFRPQVGYFVIDKLPVGIFMDISLDKQKMSQSEDEYTWTSFVLGPFARYYITNLDGFMPFAQVSAGIGAGKNSYTYSGNTSDSKYTTFSFGIGIGGTYFVTENVGFDLLIGYRGDQEKYKNESPDRSETEETTYKYGGVGLNLGIIVSLGK